MKNGRPNRVIHCLQILVPVLLIVACVALLSGCLFIPLPEHVVGKNQADFRDMTGDEHSKKPIRPHAITRAQALKLLGSPTYASEDGRSIGYELDTQGSLWLSLCWGLQAEKTNVYMLRLDFDENDSLSKWDMADSSQAYSWTPQESVVEHLNHNGPELAPTTQPNSQTEK